MTVLFTELELRIARRAKRSPSAIVAAAIAAGKVGAAPVLAQVVEFEPLTVQVIPVAELPFMTMNVQERVCPPDPPGELERRTLRFFKSPATGDGKAKLPRESDELVAFEPANPT